MVYLKVGDAEDYLAATKEILWGSELSEAQLAEIASCAEYHDKKSMLLAVGKQDFSWPWLDRCFVFFKEIRRWPDTFGWPWLRQKPPLLKKTADVVAKMTSKDLKSVALNLNIDIPKGTKVAELRELLINSGRVRMAHVRDYADQFNEVIQARHDKNLLKVKTELLAHSIRMRVFNRYRHDQVVKLVQYRLGVGVVERFDNLAKKLAPEFDFNSHSVAHMPPFYPGDNTGYGFKRKKLRARSRAKASF